MSFLFFVFSSLGVQKILQHFLLGFRLQGSFTLIHVLVKGAKLVRWLKTKPSEAWTQELPSRANPFISLLCVVKIKVMDVTVGYPVHKIEKEEYWR